MRRLLFIFVSCLGLPGIIACSDSHSGAIGGTGGTLNSGGSSSTTSGGGAGTPASSQQGGAFSSGGSSGSALGGASPALGGAAAIAGAAGAGVAGVGGVAGSPSGGEPIQISVPSFRVESMGEVTQCVDLDVGNADVLHVRGLQTMFGPGIFEVRISAVNTAAASNLRTCVPFEDLIDPDVRPLFYTKRPTSNLSLPSGIGYTLAAHQKLRFEIHALNLTDSAMDTSVSASLSPMLASAYQMEAGLLMLENTQITLPPASSETASVAYFTTPQALSPGVIFGLEGDTHKLGTRFSVASATSSNGAKTTVYEPTWNWAQPDLFAPVPPLQVPQGGGVEVSCSWQNPGNSVVHAGVAAADEACRTWLYYYPAIPTHACVLGSNASVCFPG